MKKFYSYQQNENFEQFQRKVEIVEHLLSPPVSISWIEANYQSIGKKAARAVAHKSTANILFFCILLPVVLFIFSSGILGFIDKLIGSSISQLKWSRCLFVIFPIIYLFWVIILKYFVTGNFFNCIKPNDVNDILKIKNEFLKKSINNKVVNEFFLDFSSGDHLELDRIEKNKRLIALSLCCSNRHHCFTSYMMLNVPFTLRNIWLWSFAMAVYPIFLKYYGQEFLDDKIFLDFISEIFRALLIGFVSGIVKYR